VRRPAAVLATDGKKVQAAVDDMGATARQVLVRTQDPGAFVLQNINMDKRTHQHQEVDVVMPAQWKEAEYTKTGIIETKWWSKVDAAPFVEVRLPCGFLEWPSGPSAHAT